MAEVVYDCGFRVNVQPGVATRAECPIHRGCFIHDWPGRTEKKVIVDIVPKEPDMVNSPPHYTSGGIENIDFIDAKKLDFYQGTILNYLVRWRMKGGVEDLKKAKWYLDRYVKLQEGGKRKPCDGCLNEYCACSGKAKA